MAEGEVVTDGSAASVLTASPTFAPQPAVTFAPGPEDDTNNGLIP